MSIRGWVYVLTNKSMPDLVKIGFSTKDPQLRAEELGGTGVPHPYHVEFDALIHDPREVELAVHNVLRPHHENKEFFKITASDAVKAIRKEIIKQGKSILFEQTSHVATIGASPSAVTACPQVSPVSIVLDSPIATYLPQIPAHYLIKKGFLVPRDLMRLDHKSDLLSFLPEVPPHYHGQIQGLVQKVRLALNLEK